MKSLHLVNERKLLVILFVLNAAAFYSCSDDNSQAAVSNEEQDAVEAISASLSSESGGLARTIETAVTYSEEQDLFTASPALECGQTYDNNFSDVFTGANYSYNYAVNREAVLSCTAEGNPLNFLYDATYQGTYETPRMSSNDSSVSQWIITNLEPTSNTVIFNGSYSRIGTQVSKVRNQNTFESTLTYELDNVTLDRIAQQLVSGSASVHFLGTSTNGNQYAYSGIITFNASGSAILEINGNSYTISL